MGMSLSLALAHHYSYDKKDTTTNKKVIKKKKIKVKKTISNDFLYKKWKFKILNF